MTRMNTDQSSKPSGRVSRSPVPGPNLIRVARVKSVVKNLNRFPKVFWLSREFASICGHKSRTPCPLRCSRQYRHGRGRSAIPRRLTGQGCGGGAGFNRGHDFLFQPDRRVHPILRRLRGRARESLARRRDRSRSSRKTSARGSRKRRRRDPRSGGALTRPWRRLRAGSRF